MGRKAVGRVEAKKEGLPSPASPIRRSRSLTQILPPTGPLVEEALAEAVESDVEGMPARIFTAEHLAAIALQTGRAKDKARLLAFVESGVLDHARFQAILTRHGLVEAWLKFERQFLSDPP